MIVIKFIKNFFSIFGLSSDEIGSKILMFLMVFLSIDQEYNLSLLFYIKITHIDISVKYVPLGFVISLIIMLFIYFVKDKCELSDDLDDFSKLVFINTLLWPWFLIRIPKLIKEANYKKRMKIIEEVMDA